MDLLAGIEFDIFIPSFPELQKQFGLSPFLVEALLSVNFTGYCVSLFFVGGLADRYGRRPIILLGLLTFIIGTVLCLCATSYLFLLTGRFLQGVGIAAPSILSFLIIADSYPLASQQYYLAMLNGLMNASSAAAPVLGSYITLYYNWQGNFTLLLVVGLITLLMTLAYIPNCEPPEEKQPLSFSGYLPIFQSKPLMLMIVNFILMFVPYWIFVGMSPLLYMEALNVSLAHFGYYQGALALVFAIGSVLYGLVIGRFEQKKLLHLSNLIFLASFLMIAWISFTDNQSAMLLTLAFLPFVIGQIIPTTILYPLCLHYMPEAKGKVSALIQGARLILSFFARVER